MFEKKRIDKSAKHEPSGSDWLGYAATPTGKAAIGATLVACLIIIGFAVHSGQRKATIREAWESLSKAENAQDLGLLAGRYGNTPAGAFIEYRLGLFLWDDGLKGKPESLDKAVASFAKVAASWPSSFLAPLALVQLGCVKEDQGERALEQSDANAMAAKWAEARRVYVETVSRFPGTFGAELAREHMGKLDDLEKRFKQKKVG